MINRMQIKPCPFCGQIPRFSQHDMGYGNGRGYPGRTQFTIRCDNINCYVRPQVQTDDIYHDTIEMEKLCIKRWNIRSNNYGEN